MLKKLFGFDPAKNSLRTEVLAGITTFLTMSYILAVNPAMFSLLDGMNAGSVFTATALAAVIGSLVMALFAKMPFGLAPGMGLTPSLSIPCVWVWAIRGSLHSRRC